MTVDGEDFNQDAALFAQLYVAMVQDDADKMNEAINAIGKRGAHALLATGATLCEIILDGQKPCDCGNPKCGPKMPMFLNRKTGERRDSTQVPVHVARAGQMTAAVANDDKENLTAIFAASLADGQISGVFSQLINEAGKVLRAQHAK